MAHPEGKKAASKARVLSAAGRGFRSNGYGGVGVDALAKQAGVTSGAFYAHFRSKADAFQQAVAIGLSDLRAGIEGKRVAGGDAWLAEFVDFYMSDRRTCDLGDSCALQTLTNEVARAAQATREVYQEGLEDVIEAITAGMRSEDLDRRGKAIALLAILSGGVSLARAVADPSSAIEIADAVRRAATGLLQAPGTAVSPNV